MPGPRERERVNLPPRPFFYTLDQLASLLQCELDYLKKNLIFYADGREPGIPPKSKMRAINIAPEGMTPEWRVSENSFLGFLRRRGVKFYDRGFVL